MKEFGEVVEVYGLPSSEERSGIISFNVKGIDGSDLALLLDEMAYIAVRFGLNCAEPLHKELGVKSTVRASFYLYNIEEGVEVFIETLKSIIKAFT